MRIKANSIDKGSKIRTRLFRQMNHDSRQAKMDSKRNLLQQCLQTNRLRSMTHPDVHNAWILCGHFLLLQTTEFAQPHNNTVLLCMQHGMCNLKVELLGNSPPNWRALTSIHRWLHIHAIVAWFPHASKGWAEVLSWAYWHITVNIQHISRNTYRFI